MLLLSGNDRVLAHSLGAVRTDICIKTGDIEGSCIARLSAHLAAVFVPVLPQPEGKTLKLFVYRGNKPVRFPAVFERQRDQPIILFQQRDVFMFPFIILCFFLG